MARLAAFRASLARLRSCENLQSWEKRLSLLFGLLWQGGDGISRTPNIPQTAQRCVESAFMTYMNLMKQTGWEKVQIWD
jgi:hypothetical protein